MSRTSAIWLGLGLLVCMLAATPVAAQPPSPSSDATELSLFAIEIKTGPGWDPSEPLQDQAHFREHSLNLKRLRDAGSLVMGARYSDKGLVILAARDEAHARSMMDEDVSLKAKVFKYDVHPFSVFYGGTVNQKQRQPATR